MCTVCGCGDAEAHRHEVRLAPKSSRANIRLDSIILNSPQLVQNSSQPASPTLNFGQGAAGTHVAGFSQAKLVEIERNVLSHNDHFAAQNRAMFAAKGILTLNFVSSPGSGKTTLLCRTIEALTNQVSVSVIEGDQQTNHDAERIRSSGAQAVQINTGKGCHLDASQIQQACDTLQLSNNAILFIENVGNLVCPAAFDLGEAEKIAILSVTEGADKPLKYPDMFHAADLMIINKVDLLPYVDFDLQACINYALQVNPKIKVLKLSATTGEGMSEWLNYVLAKHAKIA